MALQEFTIGMLLLQVRQNGPSPSKEPVTQQSRVARRKGGGNILHLQNHAEQHTEQNLVV